MLLSKPEYKSNLVKCLTQVDVGVESESAVLYVEGEGVDIKVTGADNFDWLSIMHHPIAVQVHIRDRRGCVFIHTARQEHAEKLSVWSAKSEHVTFNSSTSTNRKFSHSSEVQRENSVNKYVFFTFSCQMDFP